MDFPNDAHVWNNGEEYLFGKSLLITPVTHMGQRTTSVYLPAGASWYDFWTGAVSVGGDSVRCPTPIDRMPIYVKAGTILPWGPDVQFAAEKKWTDLEMRIYRGADAHFTLYEDQGDGYDYENGASSEIGMNWNDASHTLTIAARKGSFPGMPVKRRFRVVLVDAQKGIGDQPSAHYDKMLNYSGRVLSVRF